MKGLVVSKYGSISKFAKAMGWSYRRTNYIINERQEPTVSEAVRMAEAFGVKLPEAFRCIFLRQPSTNGD